MAANVETMFYVREKPWHGLGTMVTEAPNSESALSLAGLNWNVVQKDLMTTDGYGGVIPGFKANVRDADNSVLGIVTDRYKVVQNREAFAFTDALLGEGVRYETAGSLQNGRRTWMLARLPHQYIINGDEITPYLVFMNSHDGSGFIKVAMTPVRVVCQNTLNLALATAKRNWSCNHTGNIAGKMDEARDTLLYAGQYMSELRANLSREEWLKYRTLGIGGSDVSAIAGINPFKSAHQIWLEKTGQAEPEQMDSEYAHFGTLLESIVRREFIERTGMKVRQKHMLLQSDEFPFMLADLDGVIRDGDGMAVFEAKTASAYKQEVWEAGVSAPYILQVQHYMAVTGAKRTYIAALVGGNRFFHHVVERDEEMIGKIISMEEFFWENHVLKGAEPLPDGSEATTEYFKRIRIFTVSF